jgi:ribosomal protein S7
MELLEKPHVEDVVEASLRRQGQADSHGVDALDDAVRAVEPRLQLASRRVGHGGSRALA